MAGCVADEELASRSMHGVAHVVMRATAATMLVALVVASASAQTSAPTPPPKEQPQSKWSVPTPKTAPVKPAKSCSAYGEGFINVPGSDTCVKAGGYLRTEGVITLSR
jgi:porin-like protein